MTINNSDKNSNPPTNFQILDYQILNTIYSGSRTLVYRAVRTCDQLPVVIKLLKNDYPTFSELVQFRNQYTIAKNLKPPGIIETYSLEAYNNSYALIVEDFGGISLKEWTVKQKKKLCLRDFLAIAITLCNTLDILYRERIIHKDIKPANILINPETKQVKLIDFSIASLLPRETQEIQNANSLEGTLAYLSPEQTGRMNRGIDYRSDFYSLGATFYELLTGKLPFVSDDPMELVHCHLAKNPIPVHQSNPDVPLMLSEIINKLMAKNAENRYQSALGIKHDLEICLEQLQTTETIQPFALGERDISDRFVIPEKLYGREKEVQSLLDAFDRVSQGNTEMMLVAGFSGIGKTAVVREVHKPIVRQRGYFISGKYDQLGRNIPFSAFVQAFRNLMGQLLSESDSQMQTWKTKILEAVGDSGQVLIDVIPELELIIGKQFPATELSGSAAQNRFNLLMQKFVKIFTSRSHPLVMFLDDLQWADSASLKLLQLLMQDSKYLLILGAYRDNEVSPAHPFILTVDEIVKTGAVVNTITLQHLSLGDLNQLVADTLNCELSIAQPLTELVSQKTQGNPFFATQFLKALYEDEQITFHPPGSPLTKGGREGGWQCDIAEVRALAITDDVVEFMALQLQKLPAVTQNSLKLAACIGAQFDLNTLAIVSEQLPEDAATTLWKALQEGLIIPNTEVYKFFMQSDTISVSDAAANPTYRFLHDRVQQAAYSLIAEDRKQATHLSIGQLLLRDYSTSDRQERLFEIVNHLNIGIALITPPQERENLAQLNLAAGRKAKAATAYSALSAYLATGIELLPADAWESHYPLTLALHEGITEASYLNTDFEQMEGWASIVLQQAKTLLDTIEVQQTLILGAKAQGQYLVAIQIGLSVLHSLGIEFPEQPTQADIGQAFGVTRSLWADKAPSILLDLPTMSDSRILAAMEILAVLVPAAYSAAPTLMPLLIFKQVELSIQSGNGPISVFAYGEYGLILCGIIGDIENGYEFGELALSLRERLQLTSLKCRNWYVVHVLIKPWKIALSEVIPGVQEAYRSGLETGEIEMACRSAMSYCYSAYHAGQELAELARTMEAYRQTTHQYKQAVSLYGQEIYQQTVLNLLGQVEVPYCLTGAIFNQERSLPKLQAANQRPMLFMWYLNQAVLYYLFGQEREAAQTSAETARYLDGVVGQFMIPLYSFFDALIQLTQYPAASPKERQAILLQVQQHQDKLHNWATFAPSNHQHRCELIAAEQYRVLGNKTDAIEAYDRAITSAKANNFIQDEALANELAAKFYLDWGKEKVAQAYTIEAYYCYTRWGAKAKVIDLETRYPQLLQPILQQPKSSFDPLATLITITHSSTQTPSTSISDALDFGSVIKAAQALSSAIELDELLKQLTQIILQNSGADKCVLVLPQDGIWQVRAISSLEATELCCEPLDNHPQVPLKLIQYVKRMQSVVVVDNLQTDLPVIDEYLTQSQPKSVLCLPILDRGQLAGILYLNNQSTAGVFTSSRLTAIEFLCTQAAISLENARLYAECKASEKSLQETNNLLNSFLEAMPDYFFAKDLQGRYLIVNSNIANFFHTTVNEMIGKTDPDILPPEIVEAIIKIDQEVTETGITKRIEEIVPNEGVDNTYLSVKTPLRDPQGNIIGLIAISQNITDRKRTEALITQKSDELEQALQNLQQTQLQMIQSEKMSALGNLVAGVAHEINNPVGFLGGNIQPALDYINDLFGLVDLYQQKYPQADRDIEAEIEAIDLDYIREDLPKLVGSMREGVKRIRDISTSLRTFSRADTDRPVACNIHDGIDSTIMILKHRLKANEFRPEIQVIKEYGNLPNIECYAGQLNQVFMNLLANAIDALDESNKGRSYAEIANQITIETELLTEEKQVVIRIEDNGIGMSEVVREKIFDDLFTTKGVGKGTGLGLAIARQIIVEKHCGRIDVHSQVGEGTVFVLTLPANSH